ncbi:MAG: HAMP domain-containing histidine kinase [Clostridiales bacterium]|jgi:signal transduction histidine kinase|nr:HAMP domain-containing histidine kinase [Clostridiales bacterium]
MNNSNSHDDDSMLYLIHEIKNPLNNINSAIQMLEKLYSSNMNEGAIKCIDLIKRNADIQSDMIKSILQSDVKSAIGEIDANLLIENCIGLFECAAAEKNVKIRFLKEKPENFVLIDILELKEIIINLIDNALSFSPENGFLIIKLIYSERILNITISDEGPGIDGEEPDKIFQCGWSKRESVDEKINGSGLGLSYVKKIVEGMGGSITVMNKLSGGAEFNLIIPVSRQNYFFNRNINLNKKDIQN